jgi:hypothetical protein
VLVWPFASVTDVRPSVAGSYVNEVVAAAAVPAARVSDCSSRFWYWKTVVLLSDR